MTTLTVKGVPEGLYERLKQSAAESHRSINSEVIVCLERSLLSQRIDPEAFLARVDTLQRKIALPPLTDELLRKAKSEGRP
ncbi:MAG TPA: Arc family DNA-binding protein [Thermoanaerobaculia bacterium]|nr:Arc family DNA-binding protein [Thermoanaerobaculia bacterium]